MSSGGYMLFKAPTDTQAFHKRVLINEWIQSLIKDYGTLNLTLLLFAAEKNKDKYGATAEIHTHDI